MQNSLHAWKHLHLAPMMVALSIWCSTYQARERHPSCPAWCRLRGLSNMKSKSTWPVWFMHVSIVLTLQLSIATHVYFSPGFLFTVDFHCRTDSYVKVSSPWCCYGGSFYMWLRLWPVSQQYDLEQFFLIYFSASFPLASIPVPSASWQRPFPGSCCAQCFLCPSSAVPL